jgi:hypothetical protein
MKFTQPRDVVASGALARTLRHSASLAMPLVSSLLIASCASITPGLAHPAVTPHSATSAVASKQTAKAKSDSLKAAVASQQAAQARSTSKTPYLDDAISALYAHDSARGPLTAAICQEHGPQLQFLKENNIHNHVFLAALEDFFIMLEDQSFSFRGYAADINKNQNSLSLTDDLHNPTKTLRISPMGGGARFDIIHYGSDSVISYVSKNTGTPVFSRVPVDSTSYPMSERIGVESFSLLRMAMCRFAGTVIDLKTLNGFISK